ncbi:hypothetical protein Hdeb2414_s0002g00067431 [Helianthus debilis subsp. tardiflorus]
MFSITNRTQRSIHVPHRRCFTIQQKGNSPYGFFNVFVRYVGLDVKSNCCPIFSMLFIT